MKTLIFNGSPRKNGDTVSLINKLIESLDGEYTVVNTYYSDISRCVDCRYCWSDTGCSINDDMTEIYDYLTDCDNVVFATPIYFSQPTGKLLDICSRFQKYYAEKQFQEKTPKIKSKKGAVILVGGGDGKPDSAYETLKGIMRHINVTDIFKSVGSFNTNILSAKNDKIILREINELADFLNKHVI